MGFGFGFGVGPKEKWPQMDAERDGRKRFATVQSSSSMVYKYRIVVNAISY
jgi:hypothetical protein